MEAKINDYYKVDIFNYNFTEEEGKIEDYRIGNSYFDESERYIANASINPENENDIRKFKEWINLQGNMDGKTIAIDYRLLNDSIIDIICNAYHYGLLLGIRLIPENAELTKDIFDKFTKKDVPGFLIAADKVDPEIDISSNDIDVRCQKNVGVMEHIKLEKNKGTKIESVDHYNIHINHKLTKDEVKTLAQLLQENKYDKLYINYYDTDYYAELFQQLKENNVSDEIEIELLGNPVIDQKTDFERLQNIINNPIKVKYTTSNEILSQYQREPYTEGVNYYSDTEVCEEQELNDYVKQLTEIDELIKHMDEYDYSPLERIVYVEEYLKDLILNTKNNKEPVIEESQLNKIYNKNKKSCEELSNFYSIVLRKAGIDCFTYSNGKQQKNILRIKDSRYDIDNIALIDIATDIGNGNTRNCFNSFLVPIENDIYAHSPEVISIPTSLIMSTNDYYENVENSNPGRITDPLMEAIKLLQKMGLGAGKRELKTKEAEIEFYKNALANSTYIDEISYETIAEAINEVRNKEGKEVTEKERKEIIKNLQTRGNDYYVAPAIKLLDSEEASKDVNLYNMYETNTFDTHFEEMKEEVIEERKTDTMKDTEKIEEYVIDDKKVDEVVFYRDINDTGRIFTTKKVFKKFHVPVPKYVIEMDNGKNIYEMKTSDVIDILNGANNDDDPYVIFYRDIKLNENDLLYDGEITLAKTDELIEKKKLIIYRNKLQPDMLYIRRKVYEDLNLDLDVEEVIISGISCYVIDRGDLSYLLGMAEKSDIPYEVTYKDVEINARNMKVAKNDKATEVFTIYRNEKDTEKWYVRKDLFEKFNLNTSVEEVLISGLPCYVIDEKDLAYIVGNANNKYAPYKVVFKDIPMDSINMRPAKNEEATEEIEIFKNSKQPDVFFVKKDIFKHFSLQATVEKVEINNEIYYVIDPGDLEYIIGNANNRYHPYKIVYKDIYLNSENMKPAENEKAKRTLKIYRNELNTEKLYIKKEDFDKLQIKADVEEVIIDGESYYVIDNRDLTEIISKANRNKKPYKVEYEDIKINVRKMKPAENENARKTITLYKTNEDKGIVFVKKDIFNQFRLSSTVEEVQINGENYYILDPGDLEYIIGNANNPYSPYKIEYKEIEFKDKNRQEKAEDLLDNEYIPGTNFKKPRVRENNESDEEYVTYLENYYESIFGEIEHPKAK